MGDEDRIARLEAEVAHWKELAQRSSDVISRADLNFETFVRAMPVPALLHKEGAILFVNRAYTATLGWSEEAVAGHHVLDFIDPADREYIGNRVKLGVERIAGVPTREHYVLHAKGESVPVEVTVVPVYLRGARCSLAVFRDLRERKRLESQLVTAERMASLGRLAATVGHEINNPLAYVLSSLSLMKRELAALPEDEAGAVRELVSNIDEGAHRIRDVVEDLRVFSRERTGELGSIDLSHLLDRAASMASHEVRRRAQLVKSYEKLPLVSGNEARLGQVFLNLLVNAAQAIPEGDPAGNEVRIEARSAEDTVEVDVVDTGPGVEPDIAQRIFDPFFTTKVGEGTGLGLSISHHIVVSHGGTLRLVSGLPGQTRFRVVLRAGTL